MHTNTSSIAPTATNPITNTNTQSAPTNEIQSSRRGSRQAPGGASSLVIG